MDIDKFIAEVRAVDWHKYGGSWYRSDDVPDALVALAQATEVSTELLHHIEGIEPDLLLNAPIGSGVKFAIGNDHTGSYYPAVRAALPFIIQVAIQGNHRVSRNCSINIMIDLYYHRAETNDGSHKSLEQFVKSTIKEAILENWENLSQIATNGVGNESLLESLMSIIGKMHHIVGDDIKIRPNLVMTIGKFDGLHKGHLALIDELKKVATNSMFASAVMSFTPHPTSVFSGKDIPLILSPAEKFHILNQLGLEYYIEYPFTHQFAQVSPENFINDILITQLKVRNLVVGENFRFGKDGQGDVTLAKKLGAKLGLNVHIVPLVTNGSTNISAESIRKMISYKNFDGVAQACGRNFFLMGEVVHGKKKGREMGFPTANIIPHKTKLLPPVGVYHTTTFVENTGYPSITNIGNDATETHLLNFSDNLYGRTIRIDFLRWMRDMQHFTSFDDLAKQLEKDARERFILQQ